MASNYTPTKETANFGKFARIILDLCRDAVFQILAKEIAPAALPSKIRANWQCIGMSMKQLNKILSKPPGVPPGETDFDISALYTLVRNICPGIPSPSQGWDNPPGPSDILVSDDIERIREKMNALFGHGYTAALSDTEFINEMAEMRQIISRLDSYLGQNFMSGLLAIQGSTMDPDMQQRYSQRCQQLLKQDQERREQLAFIKDKLMEMQIKQEELGAIVQILKVGQMRQEETIELVYDLQDKQEAKRLRQEESIEMLQGTVTGIKRKVDALSQKDDQTQADRCQDEDLQDESTQQSDNQNVEVVADLKLYKDILLSDGRGTPVYKGVFEGSIPVAVKKIHRTGPQFTDELNEHVRLLREVENVRRMPKFSHQNIVRFLKSEMRPEFLYIAFELCQGTLKDYVDMQANWRSKLHWKNVLSQMTEGLHFLHGTMKMAHRDLKPTNVLLRELLGVTKVVLADFGQSKLMADMQCSMSTATGSFGWIAPEAGTTPEVYRIESDIFSLGCLFYYVATRGVHPFGQNPIERQTTISQSKSDLSILPPCLGCLRELITDMIQLEPGDRPSARRVSEHPSLMADDVIMDFLHRASNKINGYPQSQQNILEDPAIIPGGNWLQLLKVNTQAYLTYYKLPNYQHKQPMFKGKEGSVRHLLRAIRNCTEHFSNLDRAVKNEMGASTSDHVEFWLGQYPWLLTHVHTRMKGDKSLMDSIRKS